MKKLLFVLTIMVSIMASCEYNQKELPAPSTKTYSYTKDIVPIVTLRCNNGANGQGGCHGSINRGSSNFQSYNGFANSFSLNSIEASIRFQKDNVLNMPQYEAMLPDSEITAIVGWFNQGALNN